MKPVKDVKGSMTEPGWGSCATSTATAIEGPPGSGSYASCLATAQSWGLEEASEQGPHAAQASTARHT